jgi:hypothetical protein
MFTNNYEDTITYFYVPLLTPPTTCTIKFSPIADKNQTAINPTLSLKEPIT